jgi:pathogenesis-related protein 1
MFAVTLFYTLAFVITSFLHSQIPALVHGLPQGRGPPALNLVASRGSPRQIGAFLGAHNAVRSAHGAAPLKWSSDLAQRAEAYGDKCQFAHTNGALSSTPYGENIAAGTGDFGVFDAVRSFVSDQDQYNPANPTFLRFTQVIWKSTTEIGCAVSECNGLFGPKTGTAYLYVCLYNPPGNVLGKIKENVQA